MSKVNSSCVNCALTAFTATDDLDLAVEAWGRALSDVGLGTSDADFLRNGGFAVRRWDGSRTL